MASVAITPASPTHLVSACQVTCSVVPNNDTSSFDNTHYPANAQVTYYFKLSKSGSDNLISNVFSTNSGGTAEWDDVIIPTAGTWTLGVYKASDNSSVATASVTVA